MSAAVDLDLLAKFLRLHKPYGDAGVIATDGKGFSFESNRTALCWFFFKAGRDSVKVVTVPIVTDWQAVNEAARG